MKRLNELVKEEADKLKLHATKEELNNLNFEGLNGALEHCCIYGQLSGNCFSQRAVDLLNKCAKPYSRWLSVEEKATQDEFVYGTTRQFSPIEYYILLDDAKNDNLIAYLKSETDTLNL